MIIDMHAHFLPRAFVAAASKGKSWYGWELLRNGEGQEFLLVEERGFPLPPGCGISDPEERHRIRKSSQGVDMEALIVIAYMWNYHLETKDSIAACREVNEELGDLQKSYPDHYRGLAVLPMQDPAAAVKEMERCVKDLGIRSFAIGASVNGKNLDDPTVLPVLEQAAEAGVTLSIHPPMWARAGEHRFPRYYFANSFGAPLESSLAAMSVIYSGLLDRYPDLKLFFSQAGGWVNYGVGRFTLRYYQREDARPMSEPPENYLSRMYFDCLIHDAESLKLLVSRVGADHVVIGTDFPAGGDIAVEGGAPKWIQDQAFLTGEEKDLILYKNAMRFLGLKEAVG